MNKRSTRQYKEFKSMTKDTLPVPLFFAEIYDGESVWFEPVRLCVQRHRDNYIIDHYHKSYTYVFNGAHINKRQDGILNVHYVDTYTRLREIAPDHHLLRNK